MPDEYGSIDTGGSGSDDSGVADAASSGAIKSKVSKFLGKSSDAKGGGGSQQSYAGRYAAIPSGLKRGGKVKKTGYAKVHKGERMLTKKQARKRDRKKR
jgi:hypothetical protein